MSFLRAPSPSGLIRPARIDPKGTTGPTRGQAQGPFWRRSSPGLYVPAQAAREVVEQRILEESCRLPPRGAVTGWAALRLHGAGYLDGRSRDGATLLPVDLLLPPRSPMRPGSGILIHRDRHDSTDLTTRHGIPCTTPERAAFDAARWADGVRAAVVVFDMTLAPGLTTRERLAAYVADKGAWPGIRQVRSALALADERSKSPRETELRMIWRLDALLPAPLSNWPIADGDGMFVATPDLLSTELAVVGEFDGREHRDRSRHRDDVRRDDAYRRLGLEPFRVVGADLDDVPLVLDRIAAAVDRAARSTVPRTWMIKVNPGPVR